MIAGTAELVELIDEPLATLCPQGHALIFGPGWFCEDCGCCVFPELVREADDEPDNDYG